MNTSITQVLIVLILCGTGLALILAGEDAAARAIGYAAIGGAINAAPSLLQRNTPPAAHGPGGSP